MGDIGQIQNHQVKVDNWPLFFLQRLHHFYKKKSHCDLTLLFSTLDSVKSIKVHKLVLHACTDYFESLDVMKDSEHGEFLQLSNEMHPDVVIPIISFMYTGKLEFPVTLQPRLYEAATKLRMTILTKLLDVQPNKSNKKSPQAEESVTKVSIIQNDSLLQANRNESAEDLQEITSIDVTQTPSEVTPLPSSKQIEEPVVTLTPVPTATIQQKQSTKPDGTFLQQSKVTPVKTMNAIKTKVIKKNVGLQFATTVTAKPKVVDVSLPPTLPGRKLPVWKRKLPFIGPQSSETVQTASRRSTIRSTELPKPTRFEWDEDLNDPTTLRPVEDAPKILSHDGPIKITHPIILDEDSGTQQKESLDDSLKRSSDGSSSESPPYKRSKSDLQDMKEYGKQQQLRNEIICSEENSEDMMDADDLYGVCDDGSDDLSSFNQSSVNSSTPKPILKSVSKPEPPMASKRVRFSLEGKENNQQQSETGEELDATKQSQCTVSKQKIILPVDVTQFQSGKHHVKIVSEVLKKYPNLAKRENIKLKVVSKNPAAVPPTVQKAVEGDTGGGNKSGSSSVSYIFLTNKSSGDLLPVKPDTGVKNKGFDVENKTGPWFCHVCDEANPIQFSSYYAYRRHLVEVHELKIDARICEYCGLKNSKRNHLLYHLYTKHYIDPPAHVSFPKCSDCDYIALSDAHLVKHKSTHDPKGLMCHICNVVFKTFSALQMHLQSDWHKNKLNGVSIVLSDYPCPFCEVRFENGTDLKDHIETCHHSQKISPREGKQIYRCPYCEGLFGNGDKLGKHIVSVHWGKNNQVANQGTVLETYQPQSGQQLQYSEEAESSEVEVTENQPSSELESLTNVASGIATSLSLVGNEQTVVYYEQRTEGQDIGREATVITAGDECKDYLMSSSIENVDNRQSQMTDDRMESIEVENDDSNSRTSNTEEVNPTSCSDHDYSEPQVEDNLRQVIPIQAVGNPLGENSVIQQILPDQRLVFSNQGNVVFQSSCVNLPQRVLLTSGKMVLPRASHGEQNVILSQVLPQTRIILSSPILQQPGGIIDEGNGTIVFANSEGGSHQMENIQTVHYPLQPEESTESEEERKHDEIMVMEESTEDSQSMDERDDTQNHAEEHTKGPQMTEHQSSPATVIVIKGGSDQNHAVSNAEDNKAPSRVETAKIVDDWDETNESPQNVETSSDGPSRPEFF